MNTLKRTASQADLPMPSTKRAAQNNYREARDDPEVRTAWRWTWQKVEEGRGALANYASNLVDTLQAWWSGEQNVLPVAVPARRRVTRPIPRGRSALPPSASKQARKAPSSPSHPPDSRASAPALAPSLPIDEACHDTRAARPTPSRAPPASEEASSHTFRPHVPSSDEEDQAWIRKLRRKSVAGVDARGGPGVAKKPYKRRPHIHEKQHRAAVKEAMRRELYKLSQMKGYGQDYATFRGFMDYKERVDVALGKSLPATFPRPVLAENRLYSSLGATRIPENSPLFLQRAIQRARDTLASPRPPQPFDFQAEKLRQDRLRKDAELEARIKAKKALPRSLPAEAEAEVDRLLSKRGPISACGKESVSSQDLERLRPGSWLNDELINFYGAMVQQRCDNLLKAAGGTPGQGGKDLGKGKGRALDVHVFNSYFYSKMSDQGYEAARVGRWTKKVDVFKKDIILIPLNFGNVHWTGACINFRKKRIEFYDSLNGNGDKVFKILRTWLEKEHLDKKKKHFDFAGWVDWRSSETPQQENGCDCGVFTCQFLESLSRDAEFDFAQKDMPYLRRRMIWEIGKSALAAR